MTKTHSNFLLSIGDDIEPTMRFCSHIGEKGEYSLQGIPGGNLWLTPSALVKLHDALTTARIEQLKRENALAPTAQP